MQMRSCAVWCLSVIGLCVLANPAWAAPKKKKSKAAAAETTEQVEAAPAASSDEPKDIDSLMDDSTKKQSAPVKKQEAAEPDPDKPLYNDDATSASSWERPPAEAEKPKKKKKSEMVEEASAKGDGRNKNIGILAGYGLGLSGGLTSLNPYGLGVGLSGEYELENHLVIGLGGEYFLGSREVRGDFLGANQMETFANYIMGHASVGYSIWLADNLILRPTLHLGVAIGVVPAKMPHNSGLSITALVMLGGSLHYILGVTGWYTGVDIRYSWPWGQDNSVYSGLPLFLTFGKRF